MYVLFSLSSTALISSLVPSLGLHYAAASGDVGLVQYALSHGQPVNSVVDGVLPLHAACAGGNSQVVKLLIDHGADVNAQRSASFNLHTISATDFHRLPRKYSSDKNRDASAPIIGTTGSTPLHFAAANGNTEVVSLLLLHGAHADRSDKHGVTPEMVAEENGWVECSAILRQWIINKDRDLRERGSPLTIDDRSDISASPPSCRSKRLHVKRSMDTALAMFKTADPPWRSRETLVKTSESALLSSSPSFPPIDPNARRPSLPQIIPPASADAFRKQKPPSPAPRPSSAGTDSEHDESFYSMYGRGGASRRQHGSKYSLMTIFKKSPADEGLDPTLAPDGLSFYGSPPLASAPIPGTIPAQIRPSYSSNSSTPNLPETPAHPITPQHLNFSPGPADPSNRTGRSTPQIAHSPPMSLLNLPPIMSRPLEVEVQLALWEQSQFKDMDIMSSPSGNTGPPSLDYLDATVVIPTYKPPKLDELPPVYSEILGDLEKKAQPSPNSRPGILRAHNRSASSAQGSPLPRMIRFDSASSVERRAKDSPRGIPTPLRSDGLSPMPTSRSQIKGDKATSPAMSTRDLPIGDGKPETGENDQDENYGQILTSSTLKLNGTSVLLQRPRGTSFGSPPDAELSPIDSVNDFSIAALKSEFPFNLDDRSANLSSEHDVDGALLAAGYLGVPATSTPNTRGRGDSLSSTSSENRSTSYTSSSTRGTISTPGLSSVLASPLLSDRSLDVKDSVLSLPADDLSPPAITASSSQSTTRSHIPADIDISVISSHADAEALVQQVRQDALDLAGNQELSHTPLSTLLAAYGESLALEKKLREQKEAGKKSFPVLEATTEHPSFLPSPQTSPQRSRDFLERQHSLRDRRTTSRHRRPKTDPRRPSTAEGGVYHFEPHNE